MENSISVKDILKITNGKLICGDINYLCTSFAKDTKEINNGDVFIGFRGEKLDGGNMYRKAIKLGATGCIINNNIIEKVEKIPKKFIITVEDTVLAIQQIAKFKREKYDIPVIAITGSVGKTSTKDIIASVLSEKYNVLKTQGNMNNHIGVPMTILGLKDHTAMVVEMGMNHLGEISTLTQISKPTIAVITNVGTAHIGNLGSRENILKAKLEILDGLIENGNVVINNDNDLLHTWYLKNKNKYNINTCGIYNDDSKEIAKEINYKETSTDYILEDEKGTIKIYVPIGGEAFVYNSMIAATVGRILNIETEKIKNGIKNFKITEMRLSLKATKEGYTIIDDCYNANYDSMKSAIEYLGKIKANRKIAVLGDMLELGKYSKDLHEKVGKIIDGNNIDILITVGKEAENIAKSSNLKTYTFINNSDAINKLKSILKKGDAVLVKASNSMHFKDIVSSIGG